MLPILKPKQKKKELINLNNVVGKVKKFDENLHSKYDIEGREMIMRVLGNAVVENPDKYGEDMIFTLKPFPYKYLEIQVCSKWDSDVFPYTYPFVYARKMRFSDRTLFLTFNKYLSEVIIFAKKYVLEKPCRLKKYDREFVHYVTWGKSMRVMTYQLTTKLIREYSGEFVDSEEDNCINNNIEKINENTINIINDILIETNDSTI